MEPSDPLELAIAKALDDAGIEYRTDFDGQVPEHLDFYLWKLGIFIEVKSGHSTRIAEQMSRGMNVIAVQGMKSVEFLVQLLSKR